MNQTLPITSLVRRGETAWMLTGEHIGRTDLPLTERGDRQARELEASVIDPVIRAWNGRVAAIASTR